MKLVTTEQLEIVRISKTDENLKNLYNTIDLKDYFAKLKYKKDNSLPINTLPDYYVLKKQFNIPEHQGTFSNQSLRFSIKSYIGLLKDYYSITKPIYISKSIILNKTKKLDSLDTQSVKSKFKNAINPKDYIYSII